MEKKLKHLEMIQTIINRMAGNSFLLKGWAVTLLAGLFALAAKDANQEYMAIAYFPLLAFFALDIYFLWQERRYRGLYDHVRGLNESDIDFSMDVTAFKRSPFSCLTIGFYAPLVIVILVMRNIVR